MVLSTSERFPLLDERGARTLKNLLEHPHAPKWNYACGDMLSRDDLELVREFENALQTPAFWQRDDIPDWLRDFTQRCLDDVPFYRNRAQENNATSSTRSDFSTLPTINRQNLSRAPWSFVPDAQNLDEMVMYWTSGTTAEALSILSHPRTTSLYLPLLQQALRRNGVDFSFKNDDERVAIALICAQKKTLTYASVSSFLGNAGFVKINLHDDNWNNRDDILHFLKSCDPQILTGDPLSFYALMQLESSARSATKRVTKPSALVSSATTLSPVLKAQLETHFACPVIDIYSSNEAGMIASSTRSDNVFEILPHDLYVETLREDGSTCDQNEIGEIVVSGGRNPFLPLLRYRTGDYARLTFDEGRRFLHEFSGRAPVLFRDARDQIVSSIDVASALRPYATTVFAFHQDKNGAVELRLPNAHTDENTLRNSLRDALQQLFGARDVRIAFDDIEKTTYSSDLDL